MHITSSHQKRLFSLSSPAIFNFVSISVYIKSSLLIVRTADAKVMWNVNDQQSEWPKRSTIVCYSLQESIVCAERWYSESNRLMTIYTVVVVVIWWRWIMIITTCIATSHRKIVSHLLILILYQTNTHTRKPSSCLNKYTISWKVLIKMIHRKILLH